MKRNETIVLFVNYKNGNSKTCPIPYFDVFKNKDSQEICLEFLKHRLELDLFSRTGYKELSDTVEDIWYCVVTGLKKQKLNNALRSMPIPDMMDLLIKHSNKHDYIKQGAMIKLVDTIAF